MRLRVPLEFRESVRIAIGALRANKARGVLTTLGIIIGIVAVVLTMTAANGLRNKFRPVKRLIQKEIVNELSKEVISGKITKDSVITIYAEDGEIKFRV
jgi:ATP-dependent Clp protease ATP-binding subunit ClpA